MGDISIGKFKVRISTFFLFLGVTIAIPVLLMPFFAMLFKNYLASVYGINYVLANGWLSMMFSYLPVLVLIIIFLFAMGGDFRSFGFRWGKSSKYIQYALLWGIISGFVLFAIDSLVPQILEGYFLDISTSAGVFGLILNWGVISVLAEEVLFTGIMLTEFLKFSSGEFTFFGKKLHFASIIVALFVLLFHFVPFMFSGASVGFLLSKLPQLVYVGFFALVGNYFYEKTHSLAVPLIIHALGNLLELALIWLIL